MAQGEGAETGWIRLTQKGREAEPHSRKLMCGVITGPVDRVLSPYTVVETSGEV